MGSFLKEGTIDCMFRAEKGVQSVEFLFSSVFKEDLVQAFAKRLLNFLRL